MSISEFRYNKKRKHYSYIFKKRGPKVGNILVTSRSFVKKRKNGKDKKIVGYDSTVSSGQSPTNGI